jgi:3-oxoacyl-[acyl-carrier-protein] synthase III
VNGYARLFYDAFPSTPQPFGNHQDPNPAEVFSRLGVNPERSAALDQWGCHGTNDVLLSLDSGIKAGAIQDGSSVALVSGGIGFTYAAATIRW